MFSDHKPVIAYFDLWTFETDVELKNTLKQKLIEDYNLNLYFQEEVKESYFDDLVKEINIWD